MNYASNFHFEFAGEESLLLLLQKEVDCGKEANEKILHVFATRFADKRIHEADLAKSLAATAQDILSLPGIWQMTPKEIDKAISDTMLVLCKNRHKIASEAWLLLQKNEPIKVKNWPKSQQIKLLKPSQTCKNSLPPQEEFAIRKLLQSLGSASWDRPNR